MIAVLKDALDCIEKYRFATTVPQQNLFGQAVRWIAEHEQNWPYSFDRLCDALDIDATAVREHLLRGLENRRRSQTEKPRLSG